MKRWVVASCWAAGLVVASCASHRAPESPKSSAGASAHPSSSASSAFASPETHAIAQVWTAIGCFVGGPWSEALGAVAEERTLADVARCRQVETKLLDRPPTDGATLEALRTIDPKIVETIVQAFERQSGTLPSARKDEVIGVLRASADAAREMIEVRRVAAGLRGKSIEPSDDAKRALGATAKLEALRRTDGVEAQVVFLVIATDRLETARGLPPSAKIAVAAPAMRLIFGITPKGDSTDGHAWIDLLDAAGRTAKHLPKLPDTKDEKLEETHAKMRAAEALAEKFDAARKALAKGVVLEVATGYVDRLRTAISDEEQKETVETNAAPKK